LCSAARKDQQETKDRDTTAAPGDGTMEITENNDQNICVKSQPWSSFHHLFSFFVCKTKHCPLQKVLMKLRKAAHFFLLLGRGARFKTVA